MNTGAERPHVGSALHKGPTETPRLQVDDGRMRAAAILCLSAIVFIICLLVGTSGGVRGTDQYWYLSDIETQLGDGPQVSNTLFPRQALELGMTHSPFIHDILPQRVVLLAAPILGPYWAWILMNAVAMLLGAWLLYLAVRCKCDRVTAACAAAALLLLPIPFLYATQVLAETAIVPLLAAALLLLQRNGGLLKYTLLAVVLTLAYMSRFTMLPLLLLLPLAVIVEPISGQKRLMIAAWTVFLIAAGVLLNRAMFGGVPIPGSAIAFGVNSRGLELWYSTEPVVLTLASLVSKLAWSAKTAISGSVTTLALAATNWLLLAAAAAAVVFAWRRHWYQIAVLVLVVLGINLATLALYQPQVRYVVPTYSVLVFSAAILLGGRAVTCQWRNRLAAPAFVLLLVAGAVLIALKARTEGVEEREDRMRLEELVADIRGRGDVIYVGGTDQMSAHGVRPSVMLFVPGDQPEADWSRILDMPRWRWMLCREEELPRLRSLGVTAAVKGTTQHRGRNLLLLDLSS